ncbi:hypothetical protein BC835DRAFT_557668 [Cytidiella melzeri]|nr:hypothetical protein BC835DRAFT_557668 [Cytidiella melzeri]
MDYSRVPFDSHLLAELWNIHRDLRACSLVQHKWLPFAQRALNRVVCITRTNFRRRLAIFIDNAPANANTTAYFRQFPTQLVVSSDGGKLSSDQDWLSSAEVKEFVACCGSQLTKLIVHDHWWHTFAECVQFVSSFSRLPNLNLIGCSWEKFGCRDTVPTCSGCTPAYVDTACKAPRAPASLARARLDLGQFRNRDVNFSSWANWLMHPVYGSTTRLGRCQLEFKLSCGKIHFQSAALRRLGANLTFLTLSVEHGGAAILLPPPVH